MAVVHMSKGNRNHYKGTFKALCSAIPFSETITVKSSFSIAAVNCKHCLEVLISLKQSEILEIERKLGYKRE